MTQRRLRVPRSLLKSSEQAKNAQQTQSTSTITAATCSQQQLPYQMVNKHQPLQLLFPDFNLHVFDFLKPLKQQFDMKHNILETLVTNLTTYEELSQLCKSLSLKDLCEILSWIKATHQACDQASLCAHNHREKANVEAQTTLHLYEQASMSHEDRINQIFVEFQKKKEDYTRVVQMLHKTQQTRTHLQTALASCDSQLQETLDQVQNVEKESQVQMWHSTAILQLISQMNEALNEFVLYRDRLITLRSKVETRRRQLHNQLQEIKGNLRVFCRIRPALPDEVQEDLITFTLSQDETLLCLKPPESKPTYQKSTDTDMMQDSLCFRFDHIFSPSATQAQVFDEVSNLIQSALDGFNVALFAYGQTGSGKTFTMEGGERLDQLHEMSFNENLFSSASTQGIIPRAVHLIFKCMEDSVLKGWHYTTEVSILEIYNETIRDLLSNCVSKTNKNETITMASSRTPSGSIYSYHVMSSLSGDNKLDSKRNTSITNPVSIPIFTANDLYTYLLHAQKQRAVAATACNQQSSRSHCVFQLKIKGQCVNDSNTIASTLSMIDLAGSERVEKSLVTGDRLKEAQHINKSLSCLRDVIYSIANNKSHIPFRNSKLTMLLKDSLGGPAKTLMLVNISPLLLHFKETITSLRFAVDANACHMNPLNIK